MFRFQLSVLLLLCCVGFACAKKTVETPPAKNAQPAYTGPKKRLAVTDMEVKIAIATTVTPNANGGLTTSTTVDIPPPTDFGQGLTEMLTTSLVETKRFIMLERKALEDIKAEQARGADGTTEADTAPSPGKLLGAQALIRGAVTEYSYRSSSTSGGAKFLEGVGISASSAEATVVLDIRLYDTTTGQILDSVKAEGKAKGKAIGFDIDKDEVKMSGAGFRQSPLGQATRQAIDDAVAKIIARMDTIPWEARIAELDAAEDGAVSTLYLNGGSDSGLKVGDMLEVFRPGRDIIDPQTKLVIGRTRDTRLGACRIDTVTPTLAIAVPTEGTIFQKNDVVRFVVPPKPAPPTT